MRTSAAKVVVLALFAFAAFGSQAFAAPGDIGTVKLLKCKRAVDPTGRYIAISAYMNSTATNEKIAIKVELLKKEKGSASYSLVQTPLIGGWEEAAAGVSNYKVKKRIANLVGPAKYRAQVTFRWTDENGSESVTTRRSKVCTQTDARSDLITKSVGDPVSLPVAAARYPAVVENRGSTIASNFKLALAINGVAQPSVYVPRLLPGADRLVPVDGIRCFQSDQLVFTADAENSVSESDETNNTLTINCPSAVSTTGLLG